MKPLPFIFLCLAATAASFFAGRWQANGSSGESAAAPVKNSPPGPSSPVNSPPAAWRADWKKSHPAQQDILLQAWIGRDPRAALLFLLQLPPGSKPGQREFEKQALFAWAQRDPVAAYNYAASRTHLRLMDDLLHKMFVANESAALEMLRSRVNRASCSNHPNEWLAKDPAHACAVLSTLPQGIKQDSTLVEAFRRWVKADSAAAIAFALSLTGDRSAKAISGLIAGLPPAEAAALTLKLKDSGQMREAVWELMVGWGRKDPAAATAWAMENLPPDGLSSAMDCFATNVVQNESAFKEHPLSDVLKAFTPAAWLAIAEHWYTSNADAYIADAPAWIRPRVIEKLPGKIGDLPAWSEPGKAPAWFQKFDAPETAEFVRVMARRDSTPDSWPPLTTVPEQWKEAAALGVLDGALDAMNRSPRTAEDRVRALPADYKALLRTQLPNIDQSQAKLPALRSWLGG